MSTSPPPPPYEPPGGHQPPGPPPGHQPQQWQGPPGAIPPGPKPPRPWFKKKRFIIPGALVGFLFFIGIIGALSGGDDGETPEVAAAAATSTPAESPPPPEEPEPEPEPEPLPEASVSTLKVGWENLDDDAQDEACDAFTSTEEGDVMRQTFIDAFTEAFEGEYTVEDSTVNTFFTDVCPKKPQMTLGQENALRKAESYLEYTAFSKKGLIDQLKFEDYSDADAKWAVENVEVDWNEQAAKKAESYLEYTSFSRQGLLDQLLYEGFTQKQAEHGVKAVGY